MTDNDPFRDWPEDDGAAAGDGGPRRDFDPLFSWEAAAKGDFHAPSPPAHSDFLAQYTWDDMGAAASWHEGPSSYEPWTPALSPSGKPTNWYATRWSEAYAPQLTEAQLRLRAGVITIPHPERRWSVTIREMAETVLLALLIFLSVRASFQNFRVEGASMYPSLDDGEYLIVNKLSYATLDMSVFNFLPFYEASDDPVTHLWGKPQRGDVIVFRAPTSPNRDFIKRIIGVPGDTIEITEQNEVILNGEILDEPYIQGVTACDARNAVCEFTIPEEGSQEAFAECQSDACYFVMGDNRQNSSDSRQNWLVPEENIVGKALVTYWQDGSPEFDLAPNHPVSAAESGD
jgi:signal peptidase I